MTLMFRKLLKTHTEKISAFRLSKIFMKTKEIDLLLHYIDENKWVSGKRDLGS